MGRLPRPLLTGVLLELLVRVGPGHGPSAVRFEAHEGNGLE